MRLEKLSALILCAAVAPVASAAYSIAPLKGVYDGGAGVENVVPNSSYVMFTGVATAANGLALLEPTAPAVRDDVVLFDGLNEQINDYVAAAGSIQRNVTESDVDNGNGTRTLTIRVVGNTPAGGPGDLWPSGFATGGTPLTGGAWGVGINLPDALDGSPTSDGLNFDAGDAILSGTIAISTNGTFAAPLTLPSTLFGGAAAFPVTNWNGVMGVAFANGATGTDIQDGIEFKVVYQPVPEPTTLGAIALLSAGMLRRRR